MANVRLTSALVVTLHGSLVSLAQTADPRASAGAQPIRARPAVLILRVADAPAGDSLGPRVDVVQPRGVKTLPLSPESSLPFSAEGVPQLGPGYEFVRAGSSPPDAGDYRYFVYHVDLGDPGIVRNWEEFQRAERRQRRQARAEDRNERAWEYRKEQLLAAHEQAVAEGVEWMRAGQYREAAISLTRACDLNQGDPACRVHLALARVALGHDAEAAQALRRALQLQPKLVPMQLGLEAYFPHEEDLAIQVDALARRVAQKTKPSADEYFLLGVMAFQCRWFDEAYAAFGRAAKGRPRDNLVKSYLQLTKPAQAAR